MSDNDRKYLQEKRKDHEEYDPLAELAQFLNQDENQEFDSLPNQESLESQNSDGSFSDGDFDFPFLDEEFENDLANKFALKNKENSQDLHPTINNQEPQRAVSFPEISSIKKNDLSSINDDEEKFLNTLSPLPIQKSEALKESSLPSGTNYFSAQSSANKKETASLMQANLQSSNNSDIQKLNKSTHNPHNHGELSSSPRFENDKVQSKQSSDRNPSPSEGELSLSPSSQLIKKMRTSSIDKEENFFSSSSVSSQDSGSLNRKNPSQEKRVFSHPDLHKKESLERESAVTQKKDGKNDARHYQDSFSNIQPSSGAIEGMKGDNFFVQKNSYNDNPHPEVDTCKLVDEVVEKIEPIMVPEVLYEAPQHNISSDKIDEEFSDIFNVGSVSENSSSQKKQSDFSPSIDSKEHFFSSLPEDPQYGFADKKQVYILANPFWKFIVTYKTLIAGVTLLAILGTSFINYFRLFESSSDEAYLPFIRADNIPFKIKPEETESENDIQNNLNIYQQKDDLYKKQEVAQESLIDTSEEPKILTESQLNDSSSSLSEEFHVEDAISHALDRVIPTHEVKEVIAHSDSRKTLTSEKTYKPMESSDHSTPKQEVKTVVVNPDGTKKLVSVYSVNDYGTNRSQEKDHSHDQSSTVSHSSNVNEQELNSFVPRPFIKPSVNERKQTISRANTAVQTKMEGSQSYYVQLASQPTPELAEDSLRNLKLKFGYLIGNRILNIQPAFIEGKGTYYRVRVQTNNRNEAVSLCESIKNSGGSCFIPQ
ncbi:SPOR domain-containing protein [Bartonella ancashensis]|uniref:SPOR domain-containing protein n=1 Tax=Bartonella ancashensis TaxID=1318743 RepID=UPI0039E447CD